MICDFRYVSPVSGKVLTVRVVSNSSSTDPCDLFDCFLGVLLHDEGEDYLFDVFEHRIDVILNGSVLTYWDPVAKDFK